MTSSLVGSEMCIRDSPSCERQKHLDDVMKYALVGQRRRLVRVLNASVSYTHLTLPTICSV
eukprot:2025983-Prorocentrum_lima.AAC.1